LPCESVLHRQETDEIGASIRVFSERGLDKPTKQTLKRVRRDQRQDKAPTTQAGEFIREEFHHIRAGKHGARSPQQAIAIGLSKARRAGAELKPPAPDEQSASTRRRAGRDYRRGHGARPARRATPKRAAATARALKRESRTSASSAAIAAQTHRAASRRRKSQRSATARRAARTKGSQGRRAAARTAARTRAAARE
jgi:hypothetical protein